MIYIFIAAIVIALCLFAARRHAAISKTFSKARLKSSSGKCDIAIVSGRKSLGSRWGLRIISTDDIFFVNGIFPNTHTPLNVQITKDGQSRNVQCVPDFRGDCFFLIDIDTKILGPFEISAQGQDFSLNVQGEFRPVTRLIFPKLAAMLHA